MNLYVMHDKLAEESGPIFEAKNDAVATRAFHNLLSDCAGRVSEYALLRLGVVDHAINKITLTELPEEICVFAQEPEKPEVDQ